MRPVEMKTDVFWVGAVDWSSRDFHGYSRSPRGTTYNAYLIKDEKTTLFDTVKAEHAGELLCSISQLVNPEEVDYVVVNHLEPDHAGAACRKIIEAHASPKRSSVSPMGEKRACRPISTTRTGPCEVVKTGDSISLGKRDVHFRGNAHAALAGQHVFLHCAGQAAREQRRSSARTSPRSNATADEVNRADLAHAAMREYYANIVLPFSPIVTLKVTGSALAELKLDSGHDRSGSRRALPRQGRRGLCILDLLPQAFAEQKPARTRPWSPSTPCGIQHGKNGPAPWPSGLKEERNVAVKHHVVSRPTTTARS